MSNRTVEGIIVCVMLVVFIAFGALFGAQLREGQMCQALKDAKAESTLAICRSKFDVVPAEDIG